MVNDNYLSQLVTVPTRGDNILDLLFSNSPYFITNVQVIDNLPGTDHDAIKFTSSVVLPGKSSCKRLLYNYKRANLSLLLDVMSQVPWNTMELAGTIESSWMLFKDLFFSAVDSVFPKVQWKKSKMKHWFSCDTFTRSDICKSTTSEISTSSTLATSRVVGCLQETQ